MIEFRNVSKSFPPKIVIDDVSFSCGDGEILFLLGKSGTGKSVLLKLLVGLLQPESGEISVDGKSLIDLSEAEFLPVRRQCAMVFQFPALLDSLTVEENLLFGPRAHRLVSSRQEEKERLSRVLGLLQISESWLAHYPTELPLGLQKQIAVGRAVIIEPKYLLLDEPTTGLDPMATRAMNELIRRLSRETGVTVLVVSHDMESALGYADRILLLDSGKIVCGGSPAELQASGNSIAKAFLE